MKKLKSKKIRNYEKIGIAIERTPREKLFFITPFLFFLMVSLLFYQHFTWFKGDRIAVPIPGMMSILPVYNIQHEYDPNFKKGDTIQVKIKACSSIEPICVPCYDCTVDLYYNYEEGKQLYSKNLGMDENATMFIQIRTIPTWLYVNLNGTYFGDLRIPKANLVDYVYESSTDLTNKITFISTWVWLLAGVWFIVTWAIYGFKFLRRKIQEYKNRKNKPDYIG